MFMNETISRTKYVAPTGTEVANRGWSGEVLLKP